MDEPMNYFMATRLKLGAITMLAVAASITLIYQLEIRLHGTARATGITLFLLMLALALFNGRKKLPFLPLASAASWLRFHSYAGIYSMLLFLLHTGFRRPTGGIQTVIAILFWFVALSGVIGLLLSRLFPKRLNQSGGKSVIFENIPAIRREMGEQAQALVLTALEKTKMSTLADFYAFQLAGFFARERNFWPHVLGLQFHMAKIKAGLSGVKRYLNAEELGTLAELERLTREKDELDHQYALQKALKLWLFVHIPLTFSLIVFAALHGILAWSLTGG